MVSDGDGLSDYNEILKGFDPLVYNDTFDMTLSCEGEAVTTSVNINGLSGEQAESLKIDTVDNYMLLDERVPGYIDSAFDFTMSGDFETATISFEFDAALLEDENFVPRIYYFNEETQFLEELPNQVVQGNVVSVETTHFSKYILLNKTEFDTVWNSEIKPPDYDSNMKGLDVVFVIDSSGSMLDNDRYYVRLEAAKAFVDKLGENDTAAVVDFDTRSEVLSYFTSNHDDLYNAIDRIDSYGGTSLSVGMAQAIDLFTNGSYTRTDAYKYIILLTDGMGSYHSNYTSLALQNNIVVYTVGLGNGVESRVLKSIANGTGGKYYFAQTADYLLDIYDEISDETIDYNTDSNNDGISDYFTKLLCNGELLTGTGIPLFNDVSYDDIQYNDDYDFDGLLNSEEVEVIFDEATAQVYIKVFSSPTEFDGDDDGLDDLYEYLIGTDALNVDCDGDGLTDGEECADWFDPLNEDPDGDGRSDKQEKEEGTDPYSYNKEWHECVTDFIEGFTLGDFIQDTDSLFTMMGQVVSGFTQVADIRDAIADLIYGDYLMAGLNISGLFIEAEAAPEAAVRTGKIVLTKADDLAGATDILRFVKDKIPDAIDALEIIEDYKDFVNTASEKLNSGDYGNLTRDKAKDLVDSLKDSNSDYSILTTLSLDYKDVIEVNTNEYGGPLTDSVGNLVDSVWKCSPPTRGHAIDEALNKHSQNVGLGRNFPFVDRLDRLTRELISTKSRDLSIQKYKSDKEVTRILNRDFKVLYEFELNWRWYLKETGEENKAIKTKFHWNESEFTIGSYDTKVLEIALPYDEPISIGVYNALNNAIANFETTDKYYKYKNRLQAIKSTNEVANAEKVENTYIEKWFVLVK